MNRQFSENVTFLECAKAGVEQFFRCEHRKSKKASSYILATYDKDPIKSFTTEKKCLEALKLCKAKDLSNASNSLYALFDLLSVKRIVDIGDINGKGRYPGMQETCLIFWITDATSFTNQFKVTDKINIPGLKTIGADSFLEPFRWEQRLYTIGLTTDPTLYNSHVGVLSDAVGGHFWLIHSVKQMVQCIENCHGLSHPKRHMNVQPIHPVCHIEGVSVVLESHPGNQTPFTPERMFIYANSSVTKHFPIPESYWPQQYHKENGQFSRFPTRTAHPVFYVSTRDETHRIFEGFPCDRLSIETSALLSQLVKRPKGTCWSLFVKNSSQKHGMGYPFGFFRVSNTGNAVNLYILPYNFPKLFKILQKMKDQPASTGLKLQLSDYLRDIPAYYVPPVIKALEAVRMDHIAKTIPMDPVVANLTKYCEKIAQQASMTLVQFQNNIDTQRQVKKSFENIYDVPVDRLEQQIRLLVAKASNRSANLMPLLTQEELDDVHTVPISDMGDYYPVMEKIQVLRDPLEDEDERKQRERGLFGNPYRKQKKTLVISKSEQDSVMESLNEMEEEGSHEFKQVETGSTKRKRMMVQSKQSARKRVPPLSKQTALIVPNFEEISWSTIDSFDYHSHLKKLQEKQIEEIVVELEEKQVISEPTLIIESETEPETPILIDDGDDDRYLSAAMEISNAPTEEYTKEWPQVRKTIYEMLSSMQKDYNEANLLHEIDLYFEDAKEKERQVYWVLEMARRFKRKNVVEHVESMMLCKTF